MKKFEIKLKVGNDNGNSEQDIIINGVQLQQADVYGRVIGRLNLEELDQDDFIENLENNLVIGIAGSKYVNTGEYYVGNYTLKSGATVRNTEVGAGNNKTDSEVVYLNTIGQIAAYAVKKAHKGDKTISDIEVNVDMTTALPITQYDKREAEKFANKFMDGEHRLTVKTPQKDYYVNLKFNFVKVIPEGVTTTFALIGGVDEIYKTYNQKVRENLTKVSKDSLYMEELNTAYFTKEQRRILHISIGESTTEYPITNGIAFDPNFVQGSNNGNGHAIKKALPLFNSEFRCSYSRQMYSDVVKSSGHKFHQDTLNYLIGPLEDEAQEIYRRAVDELERSNNEVDVIMVYGGGSILMREFLEPKLEAVARQIRSKLLYVDKEYAVTLESKGLYNFTGSALFKALKEKN